MDTEITLSKRNRLFWLGRYVERTYTATAKMMEFYDMLIDSEAEPDYKGYCAAMGIPDIYSNVNDFMERFLYDETAACSVITYMNCVIGNGMVLRETLTTKTLSYLQMAEYALRASQTSEGPCVELQRVLDNIMAFMGCFDNFTPAEEARNITKNGGMVERISTMLRMGESENAINNELRKLLNRIYKSDMKTNRISLDLIAKRAVEDLIIPDELILRSVENLFEI